jgi:hypothetical protein
MRITRAYTITPEIKRILDTKVNKSDYVCRAVRKLHLLEDEFVLRDLELEDIMRHLIARAGTPYHIKTALMAHLNDD